jgi:hypothetical protein
MLYLSNSFSLGMLSPTSPEGLTLRVRPVSLEEVKSLLREGFISAVGHQGTADVIASLTGVEVPVNRVAIKLATGDRLVVLQLQVRLEEGKILSSDEVAALYQEGKATFYLVEVL